ncbi:MAG: hypothetical protein RDU14_16945 [Melioribacteraceae bacterium]|nr:hypothetical protein [Melioribacteraceae bacterium]
MADTTNNIETKLKPYMGYSRAGGSKEGAVLIFAHTAREAKKLTFPELKGWCGDQEWIDVAVNRLKGEWLYAEADQEMLKNNIPHVIDCPKSTCKQCECWGSKLNEEGICEDCIEEEKTE